MADSKPAALGEVAATSFVVAAERVKPHTKLIALLALGHLVIDLNQGAIPAVLPFLRSAHGLSYAQAATIVLVANLTSSLIQPLFGYLSDQFARRWILPTSVFLSGAGVALIGIAPGYLTVLGLVLVMGLGVAAWHPEGYKTATGVAGDRKATALSWFSLGGNVGLALGPPVITSLITALSIAGTLGMLVPTVIGQMVATDAAHESYRKLVYELGTVAPGPANLRVAPPAAVLAGTPYWAFHRFGIERRRADAIIRAAVSARRLEETTAMSIPDAWQRLQAFPGVGEWTAAKVALVALGDADAVPTGDYHLPHMVGNAFDGTARSTDERMLEILEPFRPHRARVLRLLLLMGASAPRFGPRMPLRDIARS